MFRKRPKLFVPEDNKDDKYWDRRSKNNFAARRSREARRLKENQIALRLVISDKLTGIKKFSHKNKKILIYIKILKY